MSIGATTQRQGNAAAEPRRADASTRIVMAGFDDSVALEAACADLARRGLGQLQLCRFGLEGGSPSAAVSRQVNGLSLSVSSAALFDAMRIERTDAAGETGEWMPAAQAGALWRHIRAGRPALLAKASSSEEQVGCSRVLLKHQPSFLHTSNFSG